MDFFPYMIAWAISADTAVSHPLRRSALHSVWCDWQFLWRITAKESISASDSLAQPYPIFNIYEYGKHQSFALFSWWTFMTNVRIFYFLEIYLLCTISWYNHVCWQTNIDFTYQYILIMPPYRGVEIIQRSLAWSHAIGHVNSWLSCWKIELLHVEYDTCVNTTE